MKIEELERVLIGTLRLELASVRIQVQANVKWIYVDYPRLDATMPRISLTQTGSPQRPAAVGGHMGHGGGTMAVYEETDFDIDIWVHRTNKTTGLTPKRGGTSLRDYLADQVVDVILKKRASLVNAHEDIIDIEKTGGNPHPYDEEHEIFQKTIRIRVTHLRTY